MHRLYFYTDCYSFIKSSILVIIIFHKIRFLVSNSLLATLWSASLTSYELSDTINIHLIFDFAIMVMFDLRILTFLSGCRCCN